MGCCASIKKLDWVKIDNLKEKPSIQWKEKKQIQDVFRALEKKKTYDKLAVAVFECFFRTYPKAIDYFYHIVSPEDRALAIRGTKSLANVYGDQTEKVIETLGNARFVGHAKTVIADTLVNLNESLENDEEYAKTCRNIVEFHGRLPGMNRVFFKKMFECMDESFLKELGPRNYKGARQKAMHSLFTVTYYLVAKDLPEGEIDWLAIDEFGKLKAKYTLEADGESRGSILTPIAHAVEERVVSPIQHAFRKSLGMIMGE